MARNPRNCGWIPRLVVIARTLSHRCSSCLDGRRWVCMVSEQNSAACADGGDADHARSSACVVSLESCSEDVLNPPSWNADARQ
eukprot:1054958-Amphidinium_carterae.1